MKKQILLLALMIFSGVLFTSVKNNSVKACGTNKTSSGASVNKCRVQKMQGSDVEDMDASYNIFMNPFTQL